MPPRLQRWIFGKTSARCPDGNPLRMIAVLTIRTPASMTWNSILALYLRTVYTVSIGVKYCPNQNFVLKFTFAVYSTPCRTAPHFKLVPSPHNCNPPVKWVTPSIVLVAVTLSTSRLLSTSHDRKSQVSGHLTLLFLAVAACTAMAAFTNLNDRAKIEHCLRFLASHQLLAKVMWTADTREQFSEAMQSMFDTKSADETIQKVCDQVVVSTFHIITAEFKLFIEDDKRLDVCNVIRAIKVLDDHELEEEANFIIMCILVHTALHLILSSPDAKDAWPTANKLLHKRESVEESARIASLRSEALLLVKSCVQKSLQKGPKAMATHAAQFEPPISSVMAQLSKYTQRLS
eukprot:IDg8138t1